LSNSQPIDIADFYWSAGRGLIQPQNCEIGTRITAYKGGVATRFIGKRDLQVVSAPQHVTSSDHNSSTPENAARGNAPAAVNGYDGLTGLVRRVSELV
jgi:hypothetical protein